MSVAAWLEELPEVPPIHEDFLREVHDELDRVAARAVAELEGATGDLVEPGGLRLPKSRLAALERCERSAVARLRPADGPDEIGTSALRGIAYDRFVIHQLSTGRVLDPAADLRSMLAAEGEWGPLSALDQLDDRDPLAVAELTGPIATAVAESWAGVDGSWAPRTQSRATLTLADAKVVCSGVLDVELGGVGTNRPSVVMEVKSGSPGSEHLAEIAFYALLVAARNGAAPAYVARWYPGTPPAEVRVGDGLIESAARRLAAALRRWSELIAGDRPVERPGAWCNWCPDADRCPSSLADAPNRTAPIDAPRSASRDGSEDEYEYEDDSW